MKKKMATRTMYRLTNKLSDIGYNIAKQQVDNQRAIFSLYEFQFGFARVINYIKEKAPDKVKKYREYRDYARTLTLRVNTQFIVKLDGFNAIIVSVTAMNHKMVREYNPSTRKLTLEFIGFDRFINLQKFLRYVYDMDNKKIQFTDASGYTRELVPLSFDQIILCKETKDKIINGLKDWVANEEEYRKRGMTHKIGILLYGEAGTGKSSIVRAISHMFHNAEICQMDSTGSHNSIVSQIATRAEDADGKPIIVLMEDFDLHYPVNRNQAQDIPDVFDPKNRSEQAIPYNPYAVSYKYRNMYDGGSTRELNQLLQFLDGNLSIDNTIVIATTTHIENIDPDVIRYGRFDIQVKLDYFDKCRALEYVEMFDYGEKELNEIISEDQYPIQPAQLRYKVLEYKAKERR